MIEQQLKPWAREELNLRPHAYQAGLNKDLLLFSGEKSPLHARRHARGSKKSRQSFDEARIQRVTAQTDYTPGNDSLQSLIKRLNTDYLPRSKPVPSVFVEDLIHAYNNQLQIVRSYEQLGYIPSGDPQPARLAGSAH